jgi:hypothetical protein
MPEFQLLKILVANKEGALEVLEEELVDDKIGIEFRFQGKKSGIGLTEAKWHIIFIAGTDKEVAVMITTEKLKKLARKFYDLGDISECGENNWYTKVWIPFKELVFLSNYK